MRFRLVRGASVSTRDAPLPLPRFSCVDDCWPCMLMVSFKFTHPVLIVDLFLRCASSTRLRLFRAPALLMRRQDACSCNSGKAKRVGVSKGRSAVPFLSLRSEVSYVFYLQFLQTLFRAVYLISFHFIYLLCM
jgi:hypothetical protein